MNSVNLRKLQETLDRKPLDEIAMLVRALTYGEMIELATGIFKCKPPDQEINQANLPAVLHAWSLSCASLTQVLEEKASPISPNKPPTDFDPDRFNPNGNGHENGSGANGSIPPGYRQQDLDATRQRR